MNISLEDAKEYRAENRMRRWDNEIAAQRARGDVRSMQKLSRKAKCRKWVPDNVLPAGWSLAYDTEP